MVLGPWLVVRKSAIGLSLVDKAREVVRALAVQEWHRANGNAVHRTDDSISGLSPTVHRTEVRALIVLYRSPVSA